MKPRLLLVARTRYRLPLSPSLARKFGALAERLDVRVLATSGDGRPVSEPPFELVGRARALDGLLFWLLLPYRVRRAVATHRPDAILTQGPYEAAMVRVARTGVPLVVELHGDWRTATRLYGSPLRRALAPLADAVGAWGVRGATAIRTLSPWTSSLVRHLGREPDEEFVAFMDLELFLDRPPAPLPEQPRAVFVGVLERYKNVDGLVAAWREVAAAVPGAHLHVIGDGTMRAAVEQLVRELPAQASWTKRVPQEGVARALDEAGFLLLPSRSEGLPRIGVEAFCRGRAIVGARAGGIPDLVEHEVNGLIVEGHDELVAALRRMLEDGALRARLGAGAHASVTRWQASPEEYAARVEALVRPYTVRR